MADPFYIPPPITLTRFRNVKATHKTELSLMPSELVKAIKSERAPAKARLPLLSLASYGDVKSDKGSLRHAANLKAVHGIEADYDGEEMSFDEAIRRVRTAGVESILYTTPSHSPEAPRWRALFPTNKACLPSVRDHLAALANGIFDGRLGPETFTKSQSFYFGRDESNPHFEIRYLPGERIDRIGGHPIAKTNRLADLSPELTDGGEELVGLQNEPDRELVKRALRVFPTEARDDRTTWLRVGMILHFAFDDIDWAYQTWCRWSDKSGKFDEADQQRVWRSFGRCHGEPLRVGTLFHMARSYGFEQKVKREKPSDRGALAYVDADEATPELNNNYLIKGVIDRGSLSMVYGDSAAGKTFLMLHASHCVAAEQLFFGRRTAGGASLYIAAEAGARIKNRVFAARDQYPRDKALPVRVVTSRINLFADEIDVERIIELTRETETEFGRPVAMIVVDTLARATPGMKENASEDMGLVISRMDRIREETAAAVCFVHHSGKDAAKGARGHSSAHAAVDHELAISRDDDIRYLDLGSKQRDAQDGNRATFKLTVVELGEDEDGDQVTTCVVEELNNDAPWPSAKSKKRPRAQQAVLDMLEELRRIQGDVVTREQLIDACSEPGRVSDSENRDNRRRAARRAFHDVEAEGLIHRNGDFISPYPDFDDI